MKIFIDMDQTLNDFTTSFVKTAENILSEDLSKKAKNIGKEWGLQDVLFNGHPNKNLVTEQIFNTSGFWLNMEPLPHASEVVQMLSDEHDVYIVTFPWPSSATCFIEKYYWVKKHMPFFDMSKLIYIKDKHLLHGDIIIDDKPSYLENNNCKYTIAYDYEYNRHVDVDFRSTYWGEIYEYLMTVIIGG
jgi:5'-nucleotidase